MTTAPVQSSSPLATKAESACSRFLGGPAQLSVQWVWDDDETVTVHLNSLITMPATHIHTCKVSIATMPVCRFRMPAYLIGPQERHVVMQLEYDADGCLQLRADIPIAIDKWFSDVLTPRPDPREPEWAANPHGPDEPDAPSWSPFHDPKQAYGFNIANPHDRYRIFNFLWLRDIRPVTGHHPHFIRVEHVLEITACPLLAALRQDQEKAADAAAAWTAIRTTAASYIGGGARTKSDTSAYPYLKSLADLDKQWRSFIDLQQRLLQVHGEATLEALDAIVAETIAGPFENVEGKTFRTQWVRAWQSLIALILTAGKASFADALSQVIRVATFVFDLAARDAGLMQERGRRERLEGVLVIPACAVPPRGAIPTAKQGHVRVLGVGELQTIYKECERYTLGPISRTFTVLQGERRRVQTREESVDVEHSDDAAAQTKTALADENLRHTSDLEGALRATVESGCHERDFNKLNIIYSDIYMPQTISGDWVDTDTDKVRDQVQVSRLAQEITQRATQRIVESVQQTRRVIHARRRQRTMARDIDNRDGTAHLNGLYRWLIKHSRLVLHDEGRRLVIECLVATPAAAFIAQVDQSAGVPIIPPPTLASLSIKQASDITPANYRELTSIYGIDDPPAPPEQYRQFIARLSGQASPSHDAIRLPEGFRPSAGPGSTPSPTVMATLGYVISDKNETLACIVGSYKAVYGGAHSAPAPSTIATIAAEDPAPSCCQLIEPFTQKPPIPPVVAYADTDATVKIDTSAIDIPILAYSPAQSYAITVTVLAEDDNYAERTKQWQQALYAQLLAACVEQRRRYNRERMDRLNNDLGASERAFFLGELKRQALDLLAGQYCDPVGQPAPAPSFIKTTLDEAFQWRQMAYAFFPWDVDSSGTPESSHWRGLDSVSHRDNPLLDAFLAAGSARVLLPVTPGYELALMYYLSYGALWRPDGDVALLPEPWLDAAIDLAHPCRSRRYRWWIEEPTALEVLQKGDGLPQVDLQPADASPIENEYPPERKR